MRNFIVPLNRSRKNLIAIMDYLYGQGFIPTDYYKGHICMSLECSAEFWCECYDYLVANFKW